MLSSKLLHSATSPRLAKILQQDRDENGENANRHPSGGSLERLYASEQQPAGNHRASGRKRLVISRHENLSDMPMCDQRCSEVDSPLTATYDNSLFNLNLRCSSLNSRLLH